MPNSHTYFEKDAMTHAARALRRLRKEKARNAMRAQITGAKNDQVDELAYTSRLIELYLGKLAPKRALADSLDPLSVMTGAAIAIAERQG